MAPVAAVLIVMVLSLFLSGCGTGTTVILMPDEDGTVGTVTVNAEGETGVVDKPYHAVTAGKSSSRLSGLQAMSESQVNEAYADLLKAQPARPASFILYFETGSSVLTSESQALIPRITDAIQAKMPTEIHVSGHTDTTGQENINNRLSLERAKNVEKILKGSIPTLDKVKVRSFGSKDLLVPTPPGVDEPRNRRVEVMVL